MSTLAGMNGSRALIAVILSVVALASCRERPAENPSVIYSCDEFTVYPDSVVEDTLVVRADNPLQLSGDRLIWRARAVDGRHPLYQSSQSLVDALYNRGVARLTGRRTESTVANAYDIALSTAILDPGHSMKLLRRRIERGRIASDSAAWPVATDRIVWAAAAWEVYLMTGDRQWLSESRKVVKATLVDDLGLLYDRRYGLFRGHSTVPTEAARSFPDWMGLSDRYASMGLTVNVLYLRALEILEMMNNESGITDPDITALRQRLAPAINDCLWIPNLNRYSQYLYSEPYPIASQASDNLGQSLAIIYGAATAEMASALVGNNPVTTRGIEALHPTPHNADSIYSGPSAMVMGWWNLAALKAGNGDALTAGIGALCRSAALRGDGDAAIASLPLRIIAGIELTTRGISFHPFVPQAFGGVKRLTGIIYRDSEIDITVRGTGCTIDTFRLDGRITPEHIVPAGIVPGSHHVEIVLANDVLPAGKVNIADKAVMPATPDVRWTGLREALIREGSGDTDFAVYLNGDLDEEIINPKYSLYEAPVFTAVSIAPLRDESVWGYAGAPYYYYPDSSFAMVIPFSERGADEELDIDVPQAATYFASVSFANRTGTELRQNRPVAFAAEVNGQPVGLFVGHRVEPPLLRAWSNMLALTLHKGKIKIRVHPLNYIHSYNPFIGDQPIELLSLRLIRS